MIHNYQMEERASGIHSVVFIFSSPNAQQRFKLHQERV